MQNRRGFGKELRELLLLSNWEIVGNIFDNPELIDS